MGTAPATILGTPPLRAKWQAAKKKSDDEAKKSKETSKLDTLHKNKMKGALGPDLEAWPKLYPDWSKLQNQKVKIDNTIKTYKEALKGSGLTEAVTKPMNVALKEIGEAMTERLQTAHDLLNSDMKLALKASTKVISPIVIFQQDVAKQVEAKAGKTRLKPVKIQLEVILSDDAVLKHVPSEVDNGYLAEAIRNKASFSTVIDNLAQLLKSVDNLEPEAAEDKFEKGMDAIIEKAAERAGEPILELVHVRSSYRMYQVKKGATLALAVGGAIASTVSLAASPFTGGVSTIAGIIGLIKSINTLSTEATKLALNAEEFLGKVTDDLSSLYKQYKDVQSGVVGTGELVKVTVNSLVGPVFATIGECKGDVEQAESKNDKLFIKANDQASKLGELLNDQKLLQQQLSAYEKESKPTLEPAEIQRLLQLHKKIDDSAKPVQAMIDSIGVLHTRVEKNKGVLVMLKQSLNQLAAKEPTWSIVGQILVKIGSSAAFMIAGGVNAPEPVESLKMVKAVAENCSRAIESLEAAKEAGEGLNELIKKRKK